METIVDKTTEGLKKMDIAIADVFIENNENNLETVCGKLQFNHQDGNITYYDVVANGCAWVYLTDCNGNIDSGFQYQCWAGNSLNVEGCHAFGCQC